MSRQLIIGYGDLGQRVAALALGGGDEVIAVRRTSMTAAHPALRLIAADARSLPVVEIGRVDNVLICLTPSQRSPAAYVETYVDSVRAAVAALPDLGSPRMFFASSTAVYAEDSGNWVDEHSATAGAAFNGEILHQAEALLPAGQGTALRIAGIYGPQRMMLLRRAVDPSATVQRVPPTYSNRIHVDDLAVQIYALMGHASPPPVINLVDDEPIAAHEVMDWLCSNLGLPPKAASASSGSQGKRVRSVVAAGLKLPSLRYPSFREGYAPVLDKYREGIPR